MDITGGVPLVHWVRVRVNPWVRVRVNPWVRVRVNTRVCACVCATPVSWSGVIMGALDLRLSGLLEVRSKDSVQVTHKT